jgi:putative transposase
MTCVIRRCCKFSNAGREERRGAWQHCGVCITLASQSAHLPRVQGGLPGAYRAIHSRVLQDVLTRLDSAYQAFFQRVANGEQSGYPRFQSQHRSHSFTDTQCGTGATRDQGVLVLSKSGRLAVPLDASAAGHPQDRHHLP